MPSLTRSPAGVVSRGLAALVIAAAALSGASAQSTRLPSSPPSPAPAATPAPAAEARFVRADLDTASIRLIGALRAETAEDRRALAAAEREGLEALRTNNYRAATEGLGKVIASDPAAPSLWLAYAQAAFGTARTAGSDSTARISGLDRASAAAYGALKRSGTPAQKNEALVLLARVLTEQQRWRAALDAYRTSLALAENAEIRATYERLRDQRGFKVADHSVDSDSASPRICVQFSEKLAGGRTDFSPFVALEGVDKPAISTDDQQLCVEGVKHGERYRLTVRAGLPSAVGEELKRAVDFFVYVRDRRPLVRFTGKQYVLPRVGAVGLPVVSVNTDRVAIEILRFGDRNITTAVFDDLNSEISRYTLETLKETRTRTVWTGSMDVERRLNEDVTTALPFDEVVKTLEPGIYLATARPADAPDTGDEDSSPAVQWFVVSDLGLTALSSGEGVVGLITQLSTAQPAANVTVRLISRSNEVLATERTGRDGLVRFAAALTRGEGPGAPALLVAETGQGDYAFLNLRNPAFDLTDRGVGGRTAPQALDAFITPERGVYRSGESVHVTALLRDARGKAVADMPLTLVFERPDGVEYRRFATTDQGLGGRVVSLALPQGVPQGTWRVKALIDPRRPPVGETTFMVEDYVPDRLEFELSTTATTLSPARPTAIDVTGRFLYGVPAADVLVEGEIEVTPVRERPGFAGFLFGPNEEGDEVTATREPLEDLPATDNAGKARLEVALPELPKTRRPMNGRVFVRLTEPGGRAVERTLDLPVEPETVQIGVKPGSASGSLAPGDTARFEVIAVAPEGRRAALSGVRYELFRIETRFQWFREFGQWRYEVVKASRRVSDGVVDLAASGDPTRLAIPVPDYGRYRLDLSTGDPSGPFTSHTFDAGFFADAENDTPDALDVALDKAAVQPGDTLTVAIAHRLAGRVTVVVAAEKVLAVETADLPAGGGTVRIPVTAEFGPSAYVVAFHHRALDGRAGRNPGRAVGVKWFSVDAAARTLGVTLAANPIQRPNRPLSVPVTVTGLAGEEARIVVAAVDVGILNLTNFKPPEPEKHLFGQRVLGVEIRDLFGQIIDAMGATRGRVRSGGDSVASMDGAPPTQPPLALFSGLVRVGPDGQANVTFDLPAFDGTVRVMAMAWTATKAGSASADVVVRDPVVVQSTLPRFLAAGDRTTFRLDLDNTDLPAGDVRVTLTPQGPIGLPPDQLTRTLRLEPRRRQGFTVPIEGRGVGRASVGVAVALPNGETLTRNLVLGVRPAHPAVTRRTTRVLAAGQSLTLGADLFADLTPGAGSVALSIAPSAALDVAGLIKALDLYPFGCSEQIASRLLPLLYVSELAREAEIALEGEPETRIRAAVDRLLARQGSDGSFGLWGAGEGADLWLTAYVGEVLTRAREKGVAVPEAAMKALVDSLRTSVGFAPDPKPNEGQGLAYALYVLARNGSAPVGDLRWLADQKIDELGSVMARVQIGAALALTGDRVRAERAFAAAVRALPARFTVELRRTDYGSHLRDAAAIVALGLEAGVPRETLRPALARIEEARARSPFASTQENAWLVLAARAIARDAERIELEIDGERRRGAHYRSARAADLAARPLTVTNRGADPVTAVLSVTGSPVAAEPAADRGFKVVRTFHALDGSPVDIRRVAQNSRVVVVLTVTEPKTEAGHVGLIDYLPAGLEIENPRLVSSGETGTLDWIEHASEPVSTEFRDDRFVAAFTRSASDQPTFAVAYIVRAVSPGRYVHPGAFVEDMYRPEKFGRSATQAIEVTPR